MTEQMNRTQKSLTLFVFAVAIGIAIFARGKPPEINPETEIETWYNGQIFIKEIPSSSVPKTYAHYLIKPDPYGINALEIYVSSGSGENWTSISVRLGHIFKMGEECYELLDITRDWVKVRRVLEEA